jgi:ferredoxin
MLTPGNKKLGQRLIWGFGLPSGRPDVCIGMSGLCREHCYACNLERLRPGVLARYEKNLRLSRLADFENRVRYFILNHEIAVVRVHVGGDFVSAAYACKWLRIMRRLPKVRFFFYTRAWREDAIRPILGRMARLPNCRAWFSCDRETGIPSRIPARVRLVWLMTDGDDRPPPGMDLTFRIRSLRRQPLTRVDGVRVCPEEDGIPRQVPVTCDRCGLCWRPLPEETPGRLPLPVLALSPFDTNPPGPGRPSSLP